MFKTFLEGQKNSRFLLYIELNLVQPGGNEICRIHILEDTAYVNHTVLWQKFHLCKKLFTVEKFLSLRFYCILHVSLLTVNFSFCVIAGIQMLTLLVPILVNCLLEGPALKEANNFNKVLHDQCLQKLMKIGPQYPQVWLSILKVFYCTELHMWYIWTGFESVGVHRF